jgi:hypothetical protein
MPRIPNQQRALKPQDFVVALKIALSGESLSSYAAIAQGLAMSTSEVHGSVQRARLSRLIATKELVANRIALLEFATHGVMYAFPASLGPVTRGIATASGGPSLRDVLITTDEGAPVWPYALASERGPALYPLYPSIPSVAERDPPLYDVLTLIDAVRIGAARERELALNLIAQRLA